MMQVNIQHVFDEQKANFDHFNELKTSSLSIIHWILEYLPSQKTGGGGAASVREGDSIRIITVFYKHIFEVL